MINPGNETATPFGAPTGIHVPGARSAGMGDVSPTVLADSTVIDGVPNFLLLMAGIGVVAYFVFMKDKKRSAYKHDDEDWL